jgi:hypothetical protein
LPVPGARTGRRVAYVGRWHFRSRCVWPIRGGMAVAPEPQPSPTARGNHFSCSMTAVLLARVRAAGGQDSVAELLRLAGSKRSPGYLLNIVNWVSYDEAVALWRAGARVTRHPQFARMVGEDAARRLNGSPIAALFRSLGSPENVYRQIATSSTKYSVVTKLEIVNVGPGFAEIIAVAVDGFPRDADHCAWTCVLLTQPTILFGLPPAVVEHEDCAALGAPHCRYRITWAADQAAEASAESERNSALKGQLEAMKERLRSMFETASDLIGAGEIDDVLARITDRAAVEIRAPRYLLAIRAAPGGEVHSHHRGFDEQEAGEYAQRILENHPRRCPSLGLSYRFASAVATTAVCSRSTTRGGASLGRSASCWRSTRVTRPARWTARRR